MKKNDFHNYKKKKIINKIIIVSIQILILFLLISLWQILADNALIDTFFFSSPKRILKSIYLVYADGTLFYHMSITLFEAIIGFLIATFVGTFIAIILWWNSTLQKILDPYIVVLNSLPKIALGPIIVIWVGLGMKAIIVMDVLIMIIITILSMLNAFKNCDENKILLLKSMGANKFIILIKLILPNSMINFISLLKINVGLTWVGTIMGEYLVIREGLGYLITTGSQVFDLDLVMASTILLCILASLMYFIVALFEKWYIKKYNIKL